MLDADVDADEHARRPSSPPPRGDRRLGACGSGDVDERNADGLGGDCELGFAARRGVSPRCACHRSLVGEHREHAVGEVAHHAVDGGLGAPSTAMRSTTSSTPAAATSRRPSMTSSTDPMIVVATAVSMARAVAGEVHRRPGTGLGDGPPETLVEHVAGPLPVEHGGPLGGVGGDPQVAQGGDAGLAFAATATFEPRRVVCRVRPDQCQGAPRTGGCRDRSGRRGRLPARPGRRPTR